MSRGSAREENMLSALGGIRNAVDQTTALLAQNAELVAERDAAREHGAQARLREKAAEDKRIHDTDALRAQNAELVAALKESLALNENFVSVSGLKRCRI